MIRVQLTIRTATGGIHVFNKRFERRVDYRRYRLIMTNTCGKDDELVFRTSVLCVYDRNKTKNKLSV